MNAVTNQLDSSPKLNLLAAATADDTICKRNKQIT